MIKLELLAPAKDLDHGMAAINHGADAVYIGSPKFSARKAAGTDIDQIENLAKYAHLYSARVYVALNTILYDSELEEAQKLIKQIYEAGADALIIQDMGILELSIPPLPLFASTQTHNYTPEKVLFLEKVGFKRVILARELSLDQIGKIRQSTSVELESFVHGALCVSFSGQCYMSQSVCQRSGNRGDCAQPCRSAYKLIDAKGNTLVRDKHLLSLKDLNLSNEIPDLVRAGITSFKIEGRLKDISYIKNVTAHYRLAIDKFLNNHTGYQKQSSGQCSFDFVPDPQKSFTRGFTTYNLHGRKEKLSSFHTQKAIGKQVGKVLKLKDRGFIYDGEKLNPGDGICFFAANNELTGFYVNKAEGNIIIPSNKVELQEGTALYRNFDLDFENTLKKSATPLKIPVDIKVKANPNELVLTIIDTDGNNSTLRKNLNGDKADNPEKSVETLKSQLAKLGNTPFLLKSFSLDVNTVPFVPVAKINEIRREAIELLISIRMKNYSRETVQTKPNNFPYPEPKLDYRANVSNKLSQKFYARHGVGSVEPAFELTPETADRVVMVTKHCIRYQMDACPRYNNKQQLNEPLFLKDNNQTYQLKFNCKECVMEIVKKYEVKSTK